MLAEPYYEPHVVSPNGGGMVNSFGMIVQTERAEEAALDTVIVGSPPDTRKPPDDVVRFLRDSFRRARRIAAVCVGAFILGEAGLLDGRRSTTHWMFGDELKRRFPKTRVEIDRIFVQDGPIWTSAGMTAGIDLALSLIERDLGSDKARQAARNMVIHHRRAGGQSQHSALLTLDAKSDRVQDALQYAKRNLSKPLSVEKLAQAACLSPRQFSRVFRLETGMSPRRPWRTCDWNQPDSCSSKDDCQWKPSRASMGFATASACAGVFCVPTDRRRNQSGTPRNR